MDTSSDNSIAENVTVSDLYSCGELDITCPQRCHHICTRKKISVLPLLWTVGQSYTNSPHIYLVRLVLTKVIRYVRHYQTNYLLLETFL